MISLWGVGTNPGQILNIWTGFYTVPVRYFVSRQPHIKPFVLPNINASDQLKFLIAPFLLLQSAA